MKLGKQAKIIITAIGIVLILGVSWGVYKAVSPPPDFTESIDLNDYEGLYKKYVLPATFAGVAFVEWTDANELYPESLTSFYFAVHRLSLPLGVYEYLPTNAKEVEAFVKEYFKVSVSHMRKSSYYDSKTSTYDFIGFGDSGLIKIVDAKLDGNKLLLTYECYSRADDITVWSRGVVTIKFNKNSYKYISCEHHAVD